MPFPNFIDSHKRLWTKEKVAATLKIVARQLKGPLPTSDHVYNQIKGYDHLDWPPSHRILEYFGTLSRAWIAASVNPQRVCLNYSDWNEEEILYIKEHAGEMLIKEMAKNLRRSYGAVRRKMYDLKITSRGNQGYFSASLLAKELGCSYHRLLQLLNAGVIPGAYIKKKQRWEIDIHSITDEMKQFLMDPKKTPKTEPQDLGDYEKRYNLKRIKVKGKMTQVKRELAGVC